MKKELLRETLPHGALKEVAKRAGVCNSAVSNYFNGRNNSFKIEIAAIEVAKEYEDRRRNAIKALIG